MIRSISLLFLFLKLLDEGCESDIFEELEPRIATNDEIEK